MAAKTTVSHPQVSKTKEIHVECLPDELLVSKLGFTRKLVTHHTGKSRVFHKLKQSHNVLALVDEDPGAPMTTYEMSLKWVQTLNGIKCYIDNNGNKVAVLTNKLEDWIIAICNQANIDLAKFGLPEKPNALHGVINQRLTKFAQLIDMLLQSNNESIKNLKDWLS
jgi:hypothetical protein